MICSFILQNFGTRSQYPGARGTLLYRKGDTVKEFKLPNLDEEKTVLKTIRLKLTTLQEVEELSKNANISVNRLINECIEFALKNLSKEDLKK